MPPIPAPKPVIEKAEEVLKLMAEGYSLAVYHYPAYTIRLQHMPGGKLDYPERTDITMFKRGAHGKASILRHVTQSAFTSVQKSGKVRKLTDKASSGYSGLSACYELVE